MEKQNKTLEGIRRQSDDTQEYISNQEDRIVKITQLKNQKQKKRERMRIAQGTSFFFGNLFIFIHLQLSAFSPLPSTPPQPVPPPSPTSTLPFDFVLVSFIVAPIDPSSHYPLPTPLWLLLQCS